MSTCEQGGALSNGFLDPGLSSLRLSFTDHWPDVIGKVFRIAHAQTLCHTYQFRCKLIGYGAMGQDALHRETDLPGVCKTLQCALGSSIRDICIFMHDHCRIRTQFQCAAT